MRRMLLLAGSVVVLASVAVVALASGGPTAQTRGAPLKPAEAEAHVPTSGPFALAARQADERPRRYGYRRSFSSPEDGRRSLGSRVHERTLRALAGRLEVDPDHLRLALAATRARMLSRFVDRGVLEAGERIALEGCLDDRECDPRAIRPIVRKLRFDLSTPDSLAERKEELLHALSRTLDLDEDDIEDALHTQLDVTLSIGERFGAVSERGRRLAVACFDAPAGCDVDALEAALSRIHGRDGR